MKQLLLIVLLLNLNMVVAQTLEFSPHTVKAFEAALALKTNETHHWVALEQAANPLNLMPLLVENYLDFFRVFIQEEPRYLFHLQSKKDDRINQINRVSDANPLKKWAIASIYLQSSIARSKFNEQWSAAVEMRKAFLLLEENYALFPAFEPNNIGRGLLYILVGSIPPNYQWVVKLASMKGSVAEGRTMLKTALLSKESLPYQNILRMEALFYLSFVELNLFPDKQAAADLLEFYSPADVNNPLLLYAKASIEMRTGQNDAAFQTLSSRKTLPSEIPFYYLDYLDAEAHLRQLDPKALELYSNFLAHFKGLNYRVDAARKMAWIALLNKDTASYHEQMNALKTMQLGAVEADQQAMKEALRNNLPSVELLKARLLFDGGYYVRCQEVLNHIGRSFTGLSLKEKEEYTYRSGRLAHALGNEKQALYYYRLSYTVYQNSPLYYAANAALLAGEIYEMNHQNKEAERMFNLCLSLKPEEYRQGIHAKAKAGLDRLQSR